MGNFRAPVVLVCASGCLASMRVASAIPGTTAGRSNPAAPQESTTPSSSSLPVVVADRPYSVEWYRQDGALGKDADNYADRVSIDLHYCGESCEEDNCGEWVVSLCAPNHWTECLHSQGAFDVTLPEPLHGTSAGYKVRLSESSTIYSSCSREFRLVSSDEAPMVGEPNGPFLTVKRPWVGDAATAGQTYKVEYEYGDGMGARAGRFRVDLYLSGGHGDCGVWVGALCQDRIHGCRDSTGFFDMTIPEIAPPGAYSVRVGVFTNDAIFGCSPTFDIEAPPEVSSSDTTAGTTTAAADIRDTEEQISSSPEMEDLTYFDDHALASTYASDSSISETDSKLYSNGGSSSSSSGRDADGSFVTKSDEIIDEVEQQVGHNFPAKDGQIDVLMSSWLMAVDESYGTVSSMIHEPSNIGFHDDSSIGPSDATSDLNFPFLTSTSGSHFFVPFATK